MVNVHKNGFSLIELLISLSLLSIILCICLPSVPALSKKNQLQVASNDIKSAIHFSKFQALATGNNLLLIPLPGENDWAKGMLLMVDNAQHAYNSEAKKIHEWHWNHLGTQVTWRGFQSMNYLLFKSDISTSAVNGYFIIQNVSQKKIKLVVNRLGRVREED